jgi:hypothetical protein
VNLDRLKLLIRLLLVLFVVAALALSVLPLRRAVLALAYPYQIDSVEGFLLQASLDLAEGKPIYRDYGRAPYLLCTYPPFYVVLNALPFVFGAEPSLCFGRALNLASALGILALLFWIVYAESKDTLLALLAPLVFLISFELYVWLPIARVDMVALFLSFAGIALLIRDNKGTHYRTALLLFVLSYLTKQTELVAPFAYFLFLLTRNPRAAFRFALTFICLIAALSYLLILLTDGLYYQNTIYANANRMYWFLIGVFLRDYWLRSAFFILGVGLCFLYYVLRVRTTSESQPLLSRFDLSAFYLGASLLHFLALGKTGAFVNYLLEPTLAGCLFLGLRFAEMMQPVGGTKRVAVQIVSAAAVAVLLLLHAWRTSTFDRGVAWARVPVTTQDRQAARVVFDAIERHQGSIVSDFPIFTLLARQHVVFNPFCSILALEGKWDERPFVADIAARRFSLIVSSYDLGKPLTFCVAFTPSIAAAAKENYEKIAEAQFSLGGTFYVFAPRAQP